MGSLFSPHVSGATPFAVILCRFSDLPPLSISRDVFEQFIVGARKGGMYDYWHDISYGTINLTGSTVYGAFDPTRSAVYGPYTMQYAYFQDGYLGRQTWIDEARRLAEVNGVDLSPYHGVIAVVNSNPDDSNSGHDLALGIAEWGEHGWRRCQKCQALVYSGFADGPCPAGGVHDHAVSSDYRLVVNMPDVAGQKNWRRCIKCQGLVYAGVPSPGPCQAGGVHEYSSGDLYTLPLTATAQFPGAQNNWHWCNKCQSLTYGGVAPSAGKGTPTGAPPGSPETSVPTLGPCPAGGEHDHTGSDDFTLSTPDYWWHYDTHLNVSFAAHEMGHCFDLQHAHCADKAPSVVDYCDPWDVMGPTDAYDWDPVHPFAPVGPGLNAGNLVRLGWIPDDRIWTLHIPNPLGARRNALWAFFIRLVTGRIFSGAPQPVTRQLAALTHRDASGDLLVRLVTPTRIYTVEYRQREGWDGGVSSDAVVIHEVRSPYTLGQNQWRWCNKCQALAYAGFTAGPCPAGGVHDHAGSGDYGLVTGLPGGTGQRHWKWCQKCQELIFAGDVGSDPGVCAAGGSHDVSSSLDYTLIMGTTTWAGQNNWKWCTKCQGLAYAGAPSPGPCPAGGEHDHTGSADYTLPNFGDAEPFLIGSYRAGEQWVHLAPDLTVTIQTMDRASGLATVTIAGDLSGIEVSAAGIGPAAGPR
jgi:hypothetical protein